MSEQDPQQERRASPRRWVMMRVVVDDQQSVQFGNTVNVSDTGMLIERIPELELELDQVVNVVVEGMLPEGEGDADGRRMMVVRVTDRLVALTFLP